MIRLERGNKRALVLLGFVLLVLGIIRLVPEIQIGPTPIGTDASNAYVTAYLTYQGSFLASLTSFNFFYYLLEIIHNLTHADAFLVIKSFGVGLFVLYCFSFSLVAKDVLKLNPWLVAIGTFIFGLQISTLRLSWDLYRNELGLIFLFLAVWRFTAWKAQCKLYDLVLALIAGLLVIGTHQIVGALMLIGLALCIAYWGGSRLLPHQHGGLITLVLVSALYLFLSPFVHLNGLELWAPYNPVLVPHDLVRNLFSILYPLPILILALIGFFCWSNPIFSVLTLIVLFQSLTPLFFPDRAFYLWDRWMYFLGIAFIIYSLQALQRLHTFIVGKGRPHLAWLPPLAYLAIIPLLTWSSGAFLSSGKSINSSVYEPEVLNYIPSNFIANALSKPNDKAMRQAGQLLTLLHDGRSPIYVEWRLEGFAYYYMPSLAPFFVITTGPTSASGSYYVYCQNYSNLDTGPLLPGSNPICQVWKHT